MAMPDKHLISVNRPALPRLPGSPGTLVDRPIRLYLNTAKHRGLPIGHHRPCGDVAAGLGEGKPLRVSPFPLPVACKTPLLENPKLTTRCVWTRATECSTG